MVKGKARGKGAPLLITAELPPDILSWADALRRAHYPPERNRLRAHVTLFHALPPSAEGEVRHLLAGLAVQVPPPARIGGIFDLGGGTAYDIESPGMTALHAEIAARLHGLLTKQDDRDLRLHVTVQNKVDRAAALALQATLKAGQERREFRFRGFGLYAWEDDLWRPVGDFPFAVDRGGEQP